MGALDKMMKALVDSINVDDILDTIEDKTGLSIDELKQKFDDTLATIIVIANDIETIKMQQRELLGLKKLLEDMTRKDQEDG